MAFGEEGWEILLPANLLNTDKDRLKRLLAQFFSEEHRQGEKRYENFYLANRPGFFLQGDIIKKMSSLFWDDVNNTYTFSDYPVMLLSNACDVSEENNQSIGKQALYAPVVKLNYFLETLKEDGHTPAQIDSVLNGLKGQTYSNIFYLPPNPINGN